MSATLLFPRCHPAPAEVAGWICFLLCSLFSLTMKTETGSIKRWEEKVWIGMQDLLINIYIKSNHMQAIINWRIPVCQRLSPAQRRRSHGRRGLTYQRTHVDVSPEPSSRQSQNAHQDEAGLWSALKKESFYEIWRGRNKKSKKVRKKNTNSDANIKDTLAHKSYPSDCIIPSSLRTQNESVHIVAVL